MLAVSLHIRTLNVYLYPESIKDCNISYIITKYKQMHLFRSKAAVFQSQKPQRPSAKFPPALQSLAIRS